MLTPRERFISLAGGDFINFLSEFSSKEIAKENAQETAQA
jgi:hypothetical protein